MKTKLTISALLIPLIILLSSLSFQCKSTESSDENNKNRSSNPYFPVKGDSKWQYINEGPRDETELFNVSVSGIETSGKDVIVNFNSFPFFSKQNVPASVKIKQNGEVYVIDKDSKENLLLPQSSLYQPNYTWQYGEWTAYVGGTDETAITEKGTFEHCLMTGYSLGGITFSVSIWFSKEAGIVKWGANRTNPPTLKPVYYILK